MNTKFKTQFVLSCLMYIFAFSAFAQSGVNDLTHKVMMGYQGWFLAQGDGSAVNDWRHWFKNSNDPSIDQINIDNWPDLAEYSEMYPTNITYKDGSTAELFSSYNQSTTNVHFRWMQEYNIYGIYLQRFLGEAVGDDRFFQVRNHLLENVRNAARDYDRHYALMYDVTGVAEFGFYDKLINDWEYLVDTYDMLGEDTYVKQDSMPVVAIWGMGFTHNEVTAETAMRVLDYFHKDADPKYRAYVMGGVPGRWRTLDGDSRSDALWADVYKNIDMISPWTVGRYNKYSVDGWKNDRIVPDLQNCTDNGMDYMPVIFPGGSWFNLSGKVDSSRINDNPRDGGNFYWRQAYNAISAGVQFIYVAMYDEVDEGTAMFKMATHDDELPSEGSFTPLDADGYDLPSDWYLQVADQSQQMLDGTIPLTEVLPIVPQKIAVTGISVSPTTALMAVGSYQQLVATIAPEKAYNQDVIWTSSDENIVTINSRGRAVARGLGEAIITVESDDGAFQAVCVVSVQEGQPVHDVSITPDEVTLDVGGTVQLTANVLPEDALNTSVRWIADDIKIAWVDSTGVVIAVAEGETRITVKTIDGAKRATASIIIIDSSQQPFLGSPQVIPGIIEAEDYDLGGEGVAYHDQDASNNGNQYRANESVDVESCGEGGYNVGWFNTGEWMEYTVEVLESGLYNIQARVATEQNNGQFHVEFDGRNKTGILSVPNTGGWQTFKTIEKLDISLDAGVQVMRIFRELDGSDFNINYVSIQKSTTSVEDDAVRISSSNLYPAFPNPFNNSTIIQFETSCPGKVQVIIYDLLGQEVKPLVNETLPAGQYIQTWNGTNLSGQSAATGIYFIRMQTENYVKTQKLFLLK